MAANAGMGLETLARVLALQAVLAAGRAIAAAALGVVAVVGKLSRSCRQEAGGKGGGREDWVGEGYQRLCADGIDSSVGVGPSTSMGLAIDLEPSKGVEPSKGT